MRQQQLHRGDVSCLGRAQQRRRADGQHRIRATIRPHRAVGHQQTQLQVRIGAGLQQLLDQLEASLKSRTIADLQGSYELVLDEHVVMALSLRVRLSVSSRERVA